MKLLLIFFSLVCVTDTEAVKHHQLQMTACSDADEEVMWGSDGEEHIFVDLEKKEGVITLPPFANPVQYPGMYEVAKGELVVCRKNLERLIEDFKDQLEPQDAPQSSIYSSNDIQLGSENMLVCHSTRFFPPPVTVRWTKNNVDVTDKSTLSQYYPNEDNTFNQFSHLPFTPQEGDIYTCTVEHETLETSDTKTWEVDVELSSSVGLSVFCGVCLTIGLLGVATGTFFLVKGNQCN